MKIYIVEDSKLVIERLTRLFSEQPGQQVVGTAAGELAEFRADLVGRLLRRALAQARALEVPREAVEARFATLREEHYGAG